MGSTPRSPQCPEVPTPLVCLQPSPQSHGLYSGLWKSRHFWALQWNPAAVPVHDQVRGPGSAGVTSLVLPARPHWRDGLLPPTPRCQFHQAGGFIGFDRCWSPRPSMVPARRGTRRWQAGPGGQLLGTGSGGMVHRVMVSPFVHCGVLEHLLRPGSTGDPAVHSKPTQEPESGGCGGPLGSAQAGLCSRPPEGQGRAGAWAAVTAA